MTPAIEKILKLKQKKIVYDWDEIIQSLEPYALYKAVKPKMSFQNFFDDFWNSGQQKLINYSKFGSSIKIKDEKIFKKYEEIKNSENLYKKAPFLSIAENLLELLKEGAVEQIIFLSAFDKKIFPEGDNRKKLHFAKTFGLFENCKLVLIGFEEENQGKSKANWIKEKREEGYEFDFIVDDNPNIVKEITETQPEIKIIVPNYKKNNYPINAPKIQQNISKINSLDFFPLTSFVWKTPWILVLPWVSLQFSPKNNYHVARHYLKAIFLLFLAYIIFATIILHIARYFIRLLVFFYFDIPLTHFFSSDSAFKWVDAIISTIIILGPSYKFKLWEKIIKTLLIDWASHNANVEIE